MAIFEKTIKHLNIDRWMILGKKHRNRHYHLFNKDYPLRALIERKTKIIFLITDTEKNEIVFNPLKKIDKMDEYKGVF